MNKTKKVLSLLCALAMIISMFGAFTVASAANEVALNVNVVEDTTMDADDGKITYQFSLTGVSELNAFGITMDVNTELFTSSKEAIKADALTAAGGSLTTNFNATKGKAAINWANAEGATIAEGTVIAEVTLTAAVDITSNQEINLSVVNVGAVDGTKYTIAAGNIEIAKVVIDPNAATGPVITHPITVDSDIANGTVTAPTEGVVGKTITVTATPDEGYVLDKITVNGDAIDGTTFTMPDEDVTISATFKVAPVTYDMELAVTKEGGLAAGSKYTITTTGTNANPFDIVVQVYYSDDTAVGFVVYNDVAIGDTNVFYAPAGCTVSVNAVDNVGETEADLLGNLVAANVIK